MKRLKIILNCNKTYIFLLVFLIIFIVYNIYFIKKESVYDASATSFYCTIEKYYSEGDKLKLNLMCDEKLIGYYFFKTEEEKELFNNKFKFGDYIYVTGILEEIKENNNFNLFNYKEYSYRKGIFYSLKIDKFTYIKSPSNFIHKIKNTVLDRIKNLKSFPYINSLVLGNKDYMSDEIIAIYKNIGVMHLFAISGMHVGIILLILGFILKKNHLFRDIFSIIVLLIYLNIVGGVSLLRTFIFFIVSILNKIFKLELSPLKSFLYDLYSFINKSLLFI